MMTFTDISDNIKAGFVKLVESGSKELIDYVTGVLNRVGEIYGGIEIFIITDSHKTDDNGIEVKFIFKRDNNLLLEMIVNTKFGINKVGYVKINMINTHYDGYPRFNPYIAEYSVMFKHTETKDMVYEPTLSINNLTEKDFVEFLRLVGVSLIVK